VWKYVIHSPNGDGVTKKRNFVFADNKILLMMKNAHDHKDEFPEAEECRLKSTIVDDHLDSSPTAAEAIKIISDLVVLYQKF
jgi:hypothetical protein